MCSIQFIDDDGNVTLRIEESFSRCVIALLEAGANATSRVENEEEALYAELQLAASNLRKFWATKDAERAAEFARQGL